MARIDGRRDRKSRFSERAPYQLFVLALSLAALAALAVEVAVPLEPPTREVLAIADNIVCVLFFTDFVIQLVQAPNRWQYFIHWGWIDLASSIPVIDAFRVGRAARVMRVLRVLRAIRATKLIATFILERRAEGAFLAAALVSLLLIVFASIAILQFETVQSANIVSAADAVWWSFVTITTVGYGDLYPVTWEGRVIAGLLMTAGVGLFGAFSGFVASWFLASDREEQEDDLELLRTEIASLRLLLEKQAARNDRDGG